MCTAVDDAALMDEALALATKLSEGPTVSYSTMKANIQTALDGVPVEWIVIAPLQYDIE